MRTEQFSAESSASSNEGTHRSAMDYAETAWERHAICRDEDPEIFFPQRQSEAGPAQAVCARCTVAVQCLDYALKTRTEHGIWGGATEDQRRAMLRRSARSGM